MQSETLLLIACAGAGAAIGGILRFSASKVIDCSEFPWATFVVNLVACFLAAFVTMRFGGSISESFRVFFTVGIMGGLSTMSTFANETVEMLYVGNYGYFALNVLLNVAVCILGAIAGRELALI